MAKRKRQRSRPARRREERESSGSEAFELSPKEEVDVLLMEEKEYADSWAAGEISERMYGRYVRNLQPYWEAVRWRVCTVALVDSSPETSCAAGIALTMVDQADEAEGWYERAGRLAPDDASIAPLKLGARQLAKLRSRHVRGGFLRRLVRTIIGR